MQTTRLTLMCHARTVAQKLACFPTDEPVENVGLTPAARIARFDTTRRLLCAPELRTRQTAGWFGADAEVDEALRDCDWGCWQGLSIKELQRDEEAALNRWLRDTHAAPHGGESVAQLCERVAGWLASVQATAGHMLAVTHPFVIRAALTHVLRGAAFHDIDVEPLSTVELRFNGRWRLLLPGLDMTGTL